MALEIVGGDVFNAISDKRCIFAHGVNAQGVMGSGVAAIVKKLYPYAYTKYKESKKAKTLKLGSVELAYVPESYVVVANAVTQEFYGRENKRYVSYDAVVDSLSVVASMAKDLDLPVYMPMIGGGLGGGDVKRLTAIMQAVFHDVEAYLYIQD